MDHVVRYTHQITGRVRECPGDKKAAKYMFGYAVSCATDPVLIELVGPGGVIKSHLVPMDIDVV